MSMMGGAPREHGEKVAEYSSYEGAQKAVTQLIEADIPAKDIAIVGQGLRSVETVTGKLGYATAARTGAINGILLGLVFSAIFVLGTPNAAIQLFIGVMLVGIAIGMLMSIITYSIVRRRRAFTSVTQLIADHYEITVLPRSIHQAREVFGHTVAAAPAVVTAAPVADEPPRYGERIDPGGAPQPPASERPAPPVTGPAVPPASERPAPPVTGPAAPPAPDPAAPPVTGPAEPPAPTPTPPDPHDPRS